MSSANWVIREPRVITQAIDAIDTTKNHPFGTRVRAKDQANVYGECEFIYLAGVASTIVGAAVIYDQYAGTTTLAVAGSRGPVAIAMSASVAANYGWYQISGAGPIKAGTVVANAKVYATSTAGSVDDAVVSGDQIAGMDFKTADGTPAAGFAVVEFDRPSMSGTG